MLSGDIPPEKSGALPASSVKQYVLIFISS
jgi:hypothetical protein